MSENKLKKLAETLEAMTEKSLTRYARQCMCMVLYSMGADLEIDAQTTLDLIHSEFYHRGIERIYDMTYESVAKNPDVCKAA